MMQVQFVIARELGIEYPRVEYEGSDPLGFVIAKNLARRHLSDSQRQMVAAKVAKLPVGANQHTKGPPIGGGSEAGIATTAAAAMLNVSERGVERAKAVQREGTPELIAAVESGEVSVSAAGRKPCLSCSGPKMSRLRIDKVCRLHTYSSMHTVTELHAFRKTAQAAGMSDEDIEALVNYLSAHPDAGDEMAGTGACRKVRFAIRGNKKGKSGGVRTITFYTGEHMPVFLITVFAKSQKVNLSKAERNTLGELTKVIVDEYTRRVSPLTAAGERA